MMLRHTVVQEAIRAGDGIEAALAELAEVLLPHALALTRSRPEAEELLADTLTRVFERRERLRDANKITSWARTIMYRTFIDQHRLRWRRPTVSLDLVDLVVSPRDEMHLDLKEAVRRLARTDQVLIYLHYGLGYTIDEVAGELDIPSGTVKSRLNGVLKRLRRALK